MCILDCCIGRVMLLWYDLLLLCIRHTHMQTPSLMARDSMQQVDEKKNRSLLATENEGAYRSGEGGEGPAK